MRVELIGLCFTGAEGGLAVSHNPWLVLLSYLTAAFASYVALDMADRLRQAEGNWRAVWHAAASLSLGGGIWAMHFLGMLALHLDVPFGFQHGLTLVSLAIPIIVVAVGLWLVRDGVSLARLVPAGLLVGLGVVAMHYTGMAALMIPGEIAYTPGLFALSVVIAVAAANVALWLSLNPQKPWLRAIAAFVMGVAICGMHYTGMAALVISVDPTMTGPMEGLSRPLLAGFIAAITYGLLILGLIAGIADRRISAASAREAAEIRRSYAALEEEMRERRRVEAELEQARQILEDRVAARTRDLEEARIRAETASQAKSDFLASMSHELRTPLNSVMGFAQLLLFNRAREPLTAKQERAAQQIEKAGAHLLQLIDEVLDLAKVEAGRLTLSLEPVDVSGVARDVFTTLQPAADKAGVQLSIDVPAVPVSVLADRTRLTQVLTNLLSNALKYNRPNGQALLKVQVASGGRVAVSVSDTGLGIPAHRLGELFQPFNRLGQEHGGIEGTGIGLTICQRLVEAMDGRLQVESVEHEGSTFSFELPVAEPVPSTVPGAMAEARLPRNGRTMLYVEDNPANIQLMRDLIDSLGGFQLLTAADAAAGLELARTYLPDIMILDINLPGMDGFSLLARLRADPLTASIPALALSASAMPREIERGMAAGFHHYLTKPLRFKEFMAAVDDVLAGVDA